MLNTTNNSFSHELTFNSISGTLVKSCEESKIIRFHMDSRLASLFFDEQMPRISERSKQQIDVLQVMLCSGDNFLVEYRPTNTN